MCRRWARWALLTPIWWCSASCSQIDDVCGKVDECSTKINSDIKDACVSALEDAEALAESEGCNGPFGNVLDCLEREFACGDQLPAFGTCETGFGLDCETTAVGIACQAQNSGFESCLER